MDFPMNRFVFLELCMSLWKKVLRIVYLKQKHNEFFLFFLVCYSANVANDWRP